MSITKALSDFQQKAKPIEKDASNPFHKSRYATLDTILRAIKQPLHECGLLVSQSPGVLNGNPVLQTTIAHIESGESINGVMPLLMAKADAQGIGSSITYARRYSIVAMLCLNIVDEDDDGNEASVPESKPAAKAPVKPKKVTGNGNEPIGYKNAPQQKNPIIVAMGKHKDELIEQGLSVSDAAITVMAKVKSYLEDYGLTIGGTADLHDMPADIEDTVVTQIAEAAKEGTYPWANS